MYSVSAGFLAAVRSANQVSSVLVTTSNGYTLATTGGSVEMDSRRNITRTASLSLVPSGTLSTKAIYDLVMTPNVELTIYRGLLVNGAYEYVPLGVFSTDSADYSANVAGYVSWQGSDRSKKISRARFIDPYQITAGTTLAAAGTALLQSRWSLVATNFSNVTATIGSNITYDAGDYTDPWQVARELFSTYGYDLNFDGLGTARAQLVQDPATVGPSFDFGSGTTQLVLDARVQGSLEKTYNGVVASAEGSGISTPLRAVVWDTDPASPTYYLGGYGQVPYFFSSPLLTTTAACTVAATKILAMIKGSTAQLSWPAVVNPALEPLDVVQMTIGGITVRAVIDSLNIPLKQTEPMSAVARQTAE
jgi:hypothetical protein